MKWRQHHSLQLQQSYMFREIKYKEFQEPFFFSFQQPNEIENKQTKNTHFYKSKTLCVC